MCHVVEPSAAALEDHGFDRAHRLGQTRDVNIYKLSIAENAVEERILTL